MNKIKCIIRCLIEIWRHVGYKNIANTARLGKGVKVYNKNNLIMEEETNIDAGAVIMNTRANFVIKKYSGAAIGLKVITGNHISVPGKHHKMVADKDKDLLDVNHELDRDVVVEEDVWIASNVTLLSGVHVGRCSIIGSGSVVRGNVPPYSIVVGNPAKVIGFRFTPQEALIHEESLFPEEERMSIEELQSNYQRYFVKRIKEIKEYLK